MINILNQIQKYSRLKAKSITIKQANIFTTLFIFLATIIFAYLLIIENFDEYEKTLLSKQESQEQSLVAQAEYINAQKKLKTLVIQNTIAIATLAFIIFAIMLGFSKIFNTLIQKDMQAFLDFFQASAHREETLNPDNIFFKEFKTMVGHANDMVNTISEQKRTLKELNLHLEDKVKEKTADLVLINKNLEEEKTFSQDVLKSQREFLRYTVHETNTPLSVILTSIELFVMQNKKDRQLSKIEAAVKNIFNIYDDLSYLVKKDQIEYPRIAIEIDSYLRSRVDFFEEVAALSKIKFHYQTFTQDVYIYFNETKLQRIIDNTITNAIKYTLHNEIVDISLKQEGIFLDIAVGSKSKEIKDTDKIFDSFYREEKNTEGFGIGLGLVKSICNEENIGITLESNNNKTTFTYRFKMMGN